MKIKSFYEGYINNKRPMKLAGFMSGSGTNIRKIIEYQKQFQEEPPYELVFLFSNNPNPSKCRIKEIASEYNIEYKINSLKDFYEKKGLKDYRNLEVRKEYDKITTNWLKERDIDAVALGGYMAIVTDEIFNNFITINVHPADLSIIDPITKKRKFTGDNAVRDAILAGEKEIRSSVHLATAEVDGGPIILISKPVDIKLPNNINLDDLKKPENISLLNKISDEHQNKLKEVGDWVIFPLAIEYIARGFIGHDSNNKLYFKGNLIPNGIRL
ncbi:MAG: phosphoribosylglycinamide formyltransferase [Candidatus Helarchaeota archaeon]